ncbi:MAG: site-specific DNA-methyltransferase [Desulfobulbaceae bacterium]|nr:site-specific DNA-methyltransferase [Desulfobulbaceae bacterium]
MINLHNCDCMEFMRGQHDNAYDLAITDPPYGIGEVWRKSRTDQFYRKGKLHEYTNREAPEKEYFEQLTRVSIHQIIWGGNYFTEHLPPTNAWVVWDKHRDAEATMMSEAEVAWTSFNKVMRIARFQWNGALRCEKIDNKIHPFQKPAALYKWLLKNYAKPGDRILETHGGSMSIAIACYDMGFDLDLCELDEEYFSAGKARVERHIAQGRLFEPKEAK